MTNFHNPYNFIPALPRDFKELNTSDLRDHPPKGHSVYAEDNWSGRLTVSLKTKTPLLIPDAAQVDTFSKGHKTYPIRLVNKLPYLAPTGLKGMLRSAYETVTNSRLSIFSNKGERLGYRMDTNMGRRMVPARIEDNGNSGFNIQLMPGASDIEAETGPNSRDSYLYAAWLPKYRNPVTYPDRSQPQHGDYVEAWLQLVQHYRRRNGQLRPSFQYWRVVEIARVGDKVHRLNSKRAPVQDPEPQNNNNKQTYHQRLEMDNSDYEGILKVRGYVCITGRNADNKHDERLFFRPYKSGDVIELNPAEQETIKRQWHNLIGDYQETHKNELDLSKPSALNNNSGEWSRHIIKNGRFTEHERELKPGVLCFALLTENDDTNSFDVEGLFPVTLSRDLFQKSPLELLPEELRPATSFDELSPADRVFGWANQNGQKAYKGQLRIHSVTCDSKPADAVTRFGQDGIPLAILGQPKPSQTRFYVADNQEGNQTLDGRPKERGYESTRQGLRGRKVYPHQKYTETVPDYWTNNAKHTSVTTRSGKVREYLQFDHSRSKQNRSIEAWVNPDTEFTFDIDVINLSDLELGALLYLLSLADDQYLRLGGGKPLGFGSIQLSLESTDLKKGSSWKEHYATLADEKVSADCSELTQLIEDFRAEVTRTYGRTLLSAFLKSASGYDDDKPVHYPRVNTRPQSEEEKFQWFVQNERGRRGETGKRVALDMITEDRGLPYSVSISNQNNRERNNNWRRR